MELLLGNKNYSSWSMRAWLVAHAFDIPVEITTLWLDEPDAASTKRAHSPAGRVPILKDQGITIWDSLAIAEYLAERYPDRGLWPVDRLDRARARSLAAEMHSGFFAIRTEMPMNLRAIKPARTWPDAVTDESARLFEIFQGAADPYMFGAFSIIDAFFAPVATRFKTYSVTVPTEAQRYCEALLDHPSVRTFYELASAETRRIPQYD